MNSTFRIFSYLWIIFTFCITKVDAQEKKSKLIPEFESIPLGGNAWVLEGDNYIESPMVTKGGIRNWDNPEQQIRVFFHIEHPGKISLGIQSRVLKGESILGVRFNSTERTISLSNQTMRNINIAEYHVSQGGYYYIDITGIKKDGEVFAEIEAITIKSEKNNGIRYVKDDFYFGRRGPSVHLRFEIPEQVKNIEWVYSEIMIPKGEDVIGSYFMANGFGEGYFGIQVNSEVERRILFSIWSPYKTDNPDEVPDEFKIQLLKKGEGVITGKFGDEGSGGQSYKVFNWKADLTYGFLVGAKPDNKGNTTYIAYFFDPETSKWNLIAQFKRPKTTTYLTRLYSFLENFIPHQGVFARKAYFGNQWVYSNQQWVEITKVTFTADATARKEYRLDYSGGMVGSLFYLKNCGFTNDQIRVNQSFSRNKQNKPPKISFIQ